MNFESLKNNYKVIVWGFKPKNGYVDNTISYVWESFYNAFVYMGFETYWFPDEEITGFDFSNCIFLVEAYQDNFIPLNKTSVYFVHCAYNPAKYVNNVAKFIDMRYNLNKIDHPNYKYEINKNEIDKLGKSVYYEKSTDKVIRLVNGKVDYNIDDFDKIYMSWATNLMPNQIKEDDIYLERENKVYFLGTLSNDGDYANVNLINEFSQECVRNNIEFIVNNFYNRQLSDDEYVQLCKKSLLGFDLRCKAHVDWGHIPCRIYKNISYGHLGMTNSPEVFNELEGHCVFNSNVSELFYDCMSKKNDYEFIRQSLIYVRDNHTYVNRVQSMLMIL